MQVSAKQFIDLLESQELLSDDVLQELRRQIAESKTRLTPELLAKLLVDNGHLTKFQATKLMGEISSPSNVPSNEPTSVPEPAADDELGLAEELVEIPASSVPASEAVAEVFLDDEDEEFAADEAEDSFIGGEIEEEEVEVVEVLDDSPSSTDSSDDSFSSSRAPKVQRVARPVTAKANPWDSFRILGVGVLLALILVAGFFLVNYFLRGSAEERIERADAAYEQRSYEDAATLYKEFAEAFPTNEKASYAKVRSALASLRKDAEGAPDPTFGLETAQAVLPPIAEEAGLTEQQSDLAGALVALAQKFNERADSRTETAERKELMGKMGELMEILNNPQFVGATQRSQQAPSLDRISEDRERILREINRDEELQKSLAEIDKLLDAKDTLGAYAVRSELIRRYPLLESNSEMIERVAKATEIQKSLIDSSDRQFKRSTEVATNEVGRNFILANRLGSKASSLANQILFVKAKGSVYGMNGETGEILWRKYVGRGFSSYPIRLGQNSASDALICYPEQGTLTRVNGQDGEPKWNVTSEVPTLMPVSDGEDLFVTTYEGDIANLDSESGQIKWSKRLPQPIDVPPGVAFRKPNLYLPGEHSNLYVIDRSNGECREVFYLGHRAGSISVPPILLLGQLFVFENISTDSARVRIISTNDDGLGLSFAQQALVMQGNIVVPPQVDGRRLIIQSDLGEIIVVDVEPTAETRKVNTIASVPKNLLSPQRSYAVAEDNKIWVADTRFTRFDLIVSQGKLNRAWIKNDGDTFVGPPQKLGDVVIHTRTQRGSQGVRVAAINAQTGQPIWQTDLAVPISLLHQTDANQFDVVNSNATFFALNKEPIRTSADADPGEGKPALRFDRPIWLGEDKAILLNTSRVNQLAFYDGTRSSVKILSANFGSAAPSAPPTPVGDQLAVGLNNGQLVIVNPANGTITTAPYQPAMPAGKKVKWNRPVYLESNQTLVVSSDLQKLVRLSTGDALRPLTEIDLENPLVGPLVSLGNRVFAVESTKAADTLLGFNSLGLEKESSATLDGRLIAGPYSVGELGILQTDRKVVAFNAKGDVAWSFDFPASELIAAPTQIDNQLVFANRSGAIWAVDGASGEVVGKIDAGQTLSSAPLVLPTGILVGSDEGAVLAIPMPKTLGEVAE